MTDPIRKPRRGLLVLGILVLAPLFLRLWPIEHGFPTTAYVPDTHIVRSALGMAKDKHPVPEVGQYSTYPNLLPYMLLPVYAGQYALGRVTGDFGGSGEYKAKLMEDPARAHRPARWLIALLGALTPWVVYRAARAMGLRVGAWAAAWLVATGLLHLQFSTHERPWAPMVLFLAASVWPAARYMSNGRPRDLYLSGLAAALSFSCHQSGAFSLGIAGLAWLFGPVGWSGAELTQRLRQGCLCVGLFAILSLAVGHPYYLVHGFAAKDQIAAGNEMGSNAVAIGGQAFVFDFRAETFARLTKAFFGYDPVVLVLGLAGLVLALRRRSALPPTLFALGWAAVFLTNQGDHVRYLLPLAVLLAWPAGMLVERLWTSAPARVVLLALMAFPLVQGLRLGWVLRQADTRALAADRLASLEEGAAVGSDMWGPELPLSEAALARLADHRALTGREEHRKIYYEAGVEPPGSAGLDAFPLEAIFDYALRFRSSFVEPDEVALLGEDPTEAMARLGLTHVLIVDRWPDPRRPPLLLDPASEAFNEAGEAEPKMAPLRVDPEPLWTISPGAGVRDTSLPSELSFPLTQLWKVSRPGPVLTLYRLRAD